MNNSNSKRIAKNTLLLYLRMLFTMGISLYTSRLILQKLGVDDFGIYNVVGGIITMFGFLNSAMANASQRFLVFEIGKGSTEVVTKVFNSSLFVHISIALLIGLLGETIGLWFFYAKMNIPPDRLYAASWVYHVSIFSSMAVVATVPFNTAIIAYEKMGVYAYISILQVLIKLLIVLSLDWFTYDKLQVFAILLFLSTFTSQALYVLYCKSKFSETRFVLFFDRFLLKKMLGFASWTLVGNIAGIAYTQGLNILLNIFFGPAVNAARGISVQVQNAINGFCSNFQTALNPQITKSYAKGDLSYMHSLIFASSKFSFLLLLLLSLPIIIETEFILRLWLVEVPEYTVIFFRIMIIVTLLEALSNPLMISAQAYGDIKKYQITVGGILLLIIPLSYLFLKFNYPPYIVFIIHLFVAILAQLARVFFAKKMVGLSFSDYLSKVVLRLLVVVAIVLPGPYYLSLKYSGSWKTLIVSILLSTSLVISASFFVALTNQERRFIIDKIKEKL